MTQFWYHHHPHHQQQQQQSLREWNKIKLSTTLCRNGDCEKVRALWVRFAAARSHPGKPRFETGMNYQRRKPNSTPPNRERARKLDLAETKTTQQGRQKKREWQAGRQATKGPQEAWREEESRRSKCVLVSRTVHKQPSERGERGERESQKKLEELWQQQQPREADFIAEELNGRTAKMRIFVVTSKLS